ncbi:hypothetical protein HWD99_16230 [Microbacterium sp. C5A9]|uniref:hypothetical protein n=1 Tax=Microbacterium sp. C5A9 TaxID=2736663 RepID=UPI001F524B45|nr:hypothetical protein [Microbacterium sp. C5A9]MCI1020176.1 hypothetical protein [Microbacterium sp. C5A9]
MLKKLAAISLTAGVLVLMAPAVASAAPADSDSYAETPRVAVGDPIIDICEVSTVVFGAGYFQPSENVGVSVSGFDAGASAVSGNTAASDGSMMVTFRPPADGEGSYSLAFAGTRSYTATITVSHGHDSAVSCDHDPAVAAAGSELPLTGGGLELALTGAEVSPWILGGGAAAVVAGGALVATGIVRRNKQRA